MTSSQLNCLQRQKKLSPNKVPFTDNGGLDSNILLGEHNSAHPSQFLIYRTVIYIERDKTKIRITDEQYKEEYSQSLN